MLAIGISATTAAFSVFYQVLLKPVSAVEPERLVNLRETGSKPGALWCSAGGFCNLESAFSYPMFRDLAAAQTAFTSIAAHFAFEANIVRGTDATNGRGTLVSGSYFDVLGVQPALGRLIAPRDELELAESHVAVLSHDFWQSQLASDRGIVGKTLTVNGQILTVIGVAPESFRGTTLGWRAQIYVPLTMRWLMEPTAGENRDDRRSYWLNLFARLAPGTSFEQAEAAMQSIHSAILRDRELAQQPATSDDERAGILARRVSLDAGLQGQSALRDTAHQPLTFLLTATALLLFVVCVNVANLLFARGASRATEMAVRASVGASRSRLIAQLLTEVGVLAALGAMTSVPAVVLILKAAQTVIPNRLATEITVKPDLAVLLFAIAVTASAAIAAGLLPARYTGTANPDHIVKNHGTKVLGHARGARLRSFLGISQVALSLILLVLAGLFLTSLANINRVRLGFNAGSLVTFSIAPQLNGYDAERIDALFARIRETLTSEPGIAGVTSADVPLIADRSFNFGVQVVGEEQRDDNGVLANFVETGFFDVLEIPLLAGREFTDTDGLNTAVAIVNESFVRQFELGTASAAIGRQLDFQPLANAIEIVGVVADSKYRDVKGEIEPHFFAPRRLFADFGFGVTAEHFYVRTTLPVDAVMRVIANDIAAIDPSLPVVDLHSMEAQVRENTYTDRLVTMLTASVAVLATLLAAFGLFAVLAFNVAQRSREFALRMALGARPREIGALVSRQVAAMVAIGFAIGTVGAIALGQAAESLLFGLSGFDPFVILAAMVVVAAVVVVATYWPARHAARIAPMQALRAD